MTNLETVPGVAKYTRLVDPETRALSRGRSEAGETYASLKTKQHAC